MATLNVKGLDDALYAKLKERAKQQHRSVAQEITHILEASLGLTVPLSILDLEGLGADHWRNGNAVAHVAAERDSWE